MFKFCVDDWSQIGKVFFPAWNCGSWQKFGRWLAVKVLTSYDQEIFDKKSFYCREGLFAWAANSAIPFLFCLNVLYIRKIDSVIKVHNLGARTVFFNPPLSSYFPSNAMCIHSDGVMLDFIHDAGPALSHHSTGTEKWSSSQLSTGMIVIIVFFPLVEW